MKFCPNCGAQLQDGMKFCAGCGQKVAAAPAPKPTPAPAPKPVPKAAPAAPVANGNVYGEPARNPFSAPQQTQVEQAVVHTYGTPVRHSFSAPVPPAAEQGPVTYIPGQGATAPVAPVRQQPPAPVYEEPVYEEPAYEEPAYEEPAYEEPAYEEPAYEEPAYEEPVYEEPAYEEPAYAAPAYAAPRQPRQSGYGQGGYQAPAATQSKQKSGKKLGLIIGIAVAAVAVIVLLVVLLSGGGSDDPNLGLYEAVSCEVMGIDLGVDDEWLELKSGGKATLMLMGDEYSCKWSLDGDELTLTQAGDDYYGTLEDGVIVLDFDGMVYTYVNEDYEVPKGDDAEGEQPGGILPPATVSEVGYWTLRCSDSDDPDSVMTEEDVDMLRDMGMEMYVDLKEDGTGIFMLDDIMAITWGDGVLTAEDGSQVNYYLENGELVVDLDGMILYFEPGEGSAPQIDGPAGGVEIDPGSNDLSPSDIQYWAGDYYGWWAIDTVWEGDSSLEGSWWDACATLELDEEGNGTIIIWDEDTSKEEPLAEVGMTVSIVNGDVGRFVSEEGSFMGCPVEHADWLFYSDDTEFHEMLYFDGEYVDEENDIWFYFYLRKWGTSWDDVEAVYPEDVPYYYYDWYLPLIEAGCTEAPSVIGG